MIRELSKELKTNQILVEINVKGNSITSSGCTYLLDLSHTCKSLMVINLDSNPLKGAKCLDSLISKNSLRVLILKRTQLTSQGFACLASLIRNTQTLQNIGFIVKNI